MKRMTDKYHYLKWDLTGFSKPEMALLTELNDLKGTDHSYFCINDS